MRPLVVVCLLVCSLAAACTAERSQDSAVGSSDAQRGAALAACAAEPKADLEACRTVVRLGVVESGARLPETEAFYTGMAQAFLAEGQTVGAVAMYRIAVRLYPFNADLHYKLGDVLVDRLGASEEALGPFMLAVKHRPRFPEAMLALARVQHELGYFDEAIEQYRALLEIDSSSAEAFAGVGQGLAAKGDHRGAIEVLGRAALLPSAGDEIWTALARSQSALGQPDAAAASLRRAVAINPESREAFCLRAQVLTTVGKAEEARAACIQARRPTEHRASECACTP